VALRQVVALLLIVILRDALPETVYAQQTDVIRGRVLGPDTVPIADVVVKATSYVGGVSKSTKTDKAGRFALIFVKRDGD
jgi:hypothetical protein